MGEAWLRYPSCECDVIKHSQRRHGSGKGTQQSNHPSDLKRRRRVFRWKVNRQQEATTACFYCWVNSRSSLYQIYRPFVRNSGYPPLDHCAKNLLPWFDGMLAADEEYFKQTGEPLFSSHMLDLSEESDPENIGTCAKYFGRMKEMHIWLEMEIGITGGEEDGVDNTNMDQSRLYTQPQQVYNVQKTLGEIDEKFSIAAAFGNVHGVYKPGNVKLSPEMLGKHQEFVREQLGCEEEKPLYLVMHGGSGSTKEEIACAVNNGVVKMNVDTDTQWTYWEGLKDFYEAKKGYLQGQIGNPEGEDKPNKKYYDPRVWIREAEKTMVARVKQACTDLGNVGTLDKEL